MSHSIIDLLARSVLVLVPMVLSLTVHEFAHALVAKKLGDDTAQSLGRLKLNPLSQHADPVGTFALPLIILMASDSKLWSCGRGPAPALGAAE